MNFTLTLANAITYKPEDLALDEQLEEGEEICFKYHGGLLLWTGRKAPLKKEEKATIEKGLPPIKREEETLQIPAGRYCLKQEERVSFENFPPDSGDFYLRRIAENDGKTISQILFPLF